MSISFAMLPEANSQHIMFPGGYFEEIPDEFIDAYVESEGIYPPSAYPIGMTEGLFLGYNNMTLLNCADPLRFISRPEPLGLKVR